jgi:hypothetical protein
LTVLWFDIFISPSLFLFFLSNDSVNIALQFLVSFSSDGHLIFINGRKCFRKKIIQLLTEARFTESVDAFANCLSWPFVASSVFEDWDPIGSLNHMISYSISKS